jgi:hypothetical protein
MKNPKYEVEFERPEGEGTVYYGPFSTLVEAESIYFQILGGLKAEYSVVPEGYRVRLLCTKTTREAEKEWTS